MISLNIYDWSCAELMYSYVRLHFEEFCAAMYDGSDLSVLEYVENNFCDFKAWAAALGYQIEN